MTNQQFWNYIKANKYDLDLERTTARVRYITNESKKLVAMYWVQDSYLETLDTDDIIYINEKDPLNPMTWDASQWKDAVIGLVFSAFIFAFVLFIITIFG